jgi:hypothetical protein
MAKRESTRQEKGKGKVQGTPTPIIRGKRPIKKTMQWNPPF